MELLRIVSPPSENSNSYDLKTWKEEFLKVDGDDDNEIDDEIDCPAAGTAKSNTGAASGKKVHVYCIDGMPETVAQLETTKKALGYGDELDITKMVVGPDFLEEGYQVKITDHIAANIGKWSARRNNKHKPTTIIVLPSPRVPSTILSIPNRR